MPTAEFRRQIGELHDPSRDQKERCLLFRSKDLVTDHDSAVTNTFVAVRRSLDSGHEDHAQDHAEKKRIEVSDETAHVSSHAGNSVRKRGNGYPIERESVSRRACEKL